MVYGYARVSTTCQARDGNSLEVQTELLRQNGAEVIYKDKYTGTRMDRPEFEKLMSVIGSGDKLIVSKLDRFARTARQGMELIQGLLDKGVTVHVLNMGLIDNSATGKLIVQIMLGFAEFEHDMILERTAEGKSIAKQKPGFREGRPPVYDRKEIDFALNLLGENSYRVVSEMTGISVSTLVKEKRKKKLLDNAL